MILLFKLDRLEVTKSATLRKPPRHKKASSIYYTASVRVLCFTSHWKRYLDEINFWSWLGWALYLNSITELDFYGSPFSFFFFPLIRRLSFLDFYSCSRVMLSPIRLCMYIYTRRLLSPWPLSRIFKNAQFTSSTTMKKIKWQRMWLPNNKCISFFLFVMMSECNFPIGDNTLIHVYRRILCKRGLKMGRERETYVARTNSSWS